MSGEELRAEANKHGDLRSKYMEQSKQAYERGDKKEAKELSERGKEEGVLMEQAHERAARAFFERNNPNPTDLSVIDLHGLQVKEAVDYTTKRLEDCIKKKVASLTIIVGAGNHNGGPQGRKIKPSIEEILAQKHLTFTDNKPNHGCMFVEFIQSSHSESSSSNNNTHSKNTNNNNNSSNSRSQTNNTEHEQTLVIEPIRSTTATHDNNQDKGTKKKDKREKSTCTIL